MTTPNEAQMEATTPLNVLGMAVKPIYLTDPMNAPQDTSTEDEPSTSPEDNANTSSKNPSEGENNTQQDHDWKKRYGDLKSFTDKTLSAKDAQLRHLQTQIDALNERLNAAPSSKATMPKTPEEFEEFKTKYPELADFLITGIMMNLNQGNDVVSKKLEKLEQLQQETAAKEALELLKSYHPDVLEIKADPKFKEWFDSKPPRVQALLRSSEVADVAQGLDLYKYETGQKKTSKEKAESTKDATRSVTTVSKPTIETGEKRIWKESEISRLTDAEFEKYHLDIKMAPYEGRYLAGQ